MQASPIAIFAAGVLVGAIGLGGTLAHARIMMLNSAIAGVLPDGEGSLFCVTPSNRLRPIAGVQRSSSVGAAGVVGTSHGTTLRCPAM